MCVWVDFPFFLRLACDRSFHSFPRSSFINSSILSSQFTYDILLILSYLNPASSARLSSEMKLIWNLTSHCHYILRIGNLEVSLLLSLLLVAGLFLYKKTRKQASKQIKHFCSWMKKKYIEAGAKKNDKDRNRNRKRISRAGKVLFKIINYFIPKMLKFEITRPRKTKKRFISVEEEKAWNLDDNKTKQDNRKSKRRSDEKSTSRGFQRLTKMKSIATYCLHRIHFFLSLFRIQTYVGILA